jgi:hypothetical protein
MPVPRKAGRRGRLPVLPPAERFPIKYVHEYLTAPLPAPTYPVDVSENITDWLMLANGPDPTCTTHPNGVGDCTFAGRQHYEMAKATYYKEPVPTETSNQLVAEYLAYDHGVDKGANIAHLLLSWYKSRKILAFAPVDHTNRLAVDAAMVAFRGVYVGVTLTDNADQLFEAGRPWALNGQQPDPNEGHCIVKVGSDGTNLDTWVTWGALQRSEFDWTAACLDEAWVIIAPQEATVVDLPQLRADINAFHGRGG